MVSLFKVIKMDLHAWLETVLLVLQLDDLDSGDHPPLPTPAAEITPTVWRHFPPYKEQGGGCISYRTQSRDLWF